MRGQDVKKNVKFIDSLTRRINGCKNSITLSSYQSSNLTLILKYKIISL